MQIDTKMRRCDLQSLVDLLKQQSDVKYDVVVPQSKLAYDQHAHLLIEGGGVRLTDTGGETTSVALDPMERFEDGISERLGIPRQYLRKMHDSGLPMLVAENVNTWLRQEPGKKVLVRGFRTDDPDEMGIARAFLSDRFQPVDNLDVLMAMLDGVRQAGVHAVVDSADLSERSMRVNVTAPEVQALAPVWLGRYRSPWEDVAAREGMAYGEGEKPIVFAGFVLGNSETGGGAFSLTPRVIVQICKNGLTIKHDAVRKVHVGGRLDEGVIQWSADTMRRSIELVTAQTRDAVKTFLDADYVAKVVRDIEKKAGAPVEDAAATIERVSKLMLFSQAEQATILDAFIRSGDLTAGGVMNAVTATAQTLDDPDRAAEMEDSGLDVLDLAAV